MTEAEKYKIDSLLSKIVDEGNCPRVTDELCELLLDRQDLQAYYSRAVTMHALLCHEFLQSGQSQPAELFGALSTGSLSSTSIGKTDHDHRLSRKKKQTWSWSRAKVLGACLAASLIGLMVYAPWKSDQGSDPESVASEGVRGIVVEANLVVNDKGSLRLLERLTRRASISSLRLPATNKFDFPGFRLCSGTAWIERQPEHVERGYLVALPAGCLMSMYIDTDAKGKNSLAMAGIDGNGIVNEKTLLLNNSIGSKTKWGERVGCLGTFSELNDTSSTKFFLLTGSYMLYGEEDEEQWFQSDYRVQFNTDDLLVIGWDDSGYIKHTPDKPERHRPDRDYNDVRATIRFSFPGREKLPSTEPLVSYEPAPPSPVELADSTVIGHLLNVKQGETLVLSVSSEARLQNSVSVVHSQSRRVVWQRDGSPATSSSLRKQVADRGVFVIRNHGKTVQNYEIQGYHTRSFEGPLSPSGYKVVCQGENFEVIGFEDSVGHESHVDWQDLRVSARWITPTP